MPGASAFRTRRIVAAAAAAGITESHRHDRDARVVVEGVAVYAHPCAQAFAARIVPRNSCRVDFRARRLTDNQDSRAGACAQYGIGSEWQMLFADAAGANLPQHRIE